MAPLSLSWSLNSPAFSSIIILLASPYILSFFPRLLSDVSSLLSSLSYLSFVFSSLSLFHRQIKTIEQVQIGKYLLDTWYYSPYPDEVRTGFYVFMFLFFHVFAVWGVWMLQDRFVSFTFCFLFEEFERSPSWCVCLGM